MAEAIQRPVRPPRHPGRAPWRRFKVFARRYRATTLLASLVLLILLAPAYASGSVFFSLLWTAVLATGIYAVSRKPWMLRLSLVLGTPALLGPWVHRATELGWVRIASLLLISVFYGFLLVMVFSRVFRSRVITLDTVMGGVCGYFLIGMGYSMLYRAVLLVDPHAIAHSAAPDGWAAQADAAYFSFITLTTLGYGDMTPVSMRAQSLVMLESVTGVLYVATLVAWLVASLSRRRS